MTTKTKTRKKEKGEAMNPLCRWRVATKTSEKRTLTLTFTEPYCNSSLSITKSIVVSVPHTTTSGLTVPLTNAHTTRASCTYTRRAHTTRQDRRPHTMQTHFGHTPRSQGRAAACALVGQHVRKKPVIKATHHTIHVGGGKAAQEAREEVRVHQNDMKNEPSCFSGSASTSTARTHCNSPHSPALPPVSLLAAQNTLTKCD